MDADLDRLIHLQQIDSAVDAARRGLAAEPERQKTLDDRLDATRQAVAGAKERLAQSQTARREIEKDVAVQQGRLSKYREQAMSVKTNVEYHAIQKEIGFAQGEIKTLEDRILERMLESDEFTAEVKRAEAELAREQKAVEADRRTLAAESADLHASVERLAAERAGLVGALAPQALALFEQVAAKRHGVAVAEARAGICTICHVRLRPQVFNTVLRNESIVQCDSCQRILFYVPTTAATPADGVGQSAQ